MRDLGDNRSEVFSPARQGKYVTTRERRSPTHDAPRGYAIQGARVGNRVAPALVLLADFQKLAR